MSEYNHTYIRITSKEEFDLSIEFYRSKGYKIGYSKSYYNYEDNPSITFIYNSNIHHSDFNTNVNFENITLEFREWIRKKRNSYNLKVGDTFKNFNRNLTTIKYVGKGYLELVTSEGNYYKVNAEKVIRYLKLGDYTDYKSIDDKTPNNICIGINVENIKKVLDKNYHARKFSWGEKEIKPQDKILNLPEPLRTLAIKDYENQYGKYPNTSATCIDIPWLLYKKSDRRDYYFWKEVYYGRWPELTEEIEEEINKLNFKQHHHEVHRTSTTDTTGTRSEAIKLRRSSSKVASGIQLTRNPTIVRSRRAKIGDFKITTTSKFTINS